MIKIVFVFPLKKFCCMPDNLFFSGHLKTYLICYLYVCLLHNPDLHNLKKEPCENIVEKGGNAGNQHFLLFPQSFLPVIEQISNF